MASPAPRIPERSGTGMSNAVPPLGRSLVTGLRAVAGIVVCVLLSHGGVARATCGDWLAGHGRMEHAAVESRPGSVVFEPVALRTQSGPTAPARPVCDGPACRGIPSMPLLPGEGVAIEVPVDPACLSMLADPPERRVERGNPAASDRVPLSAVGSVPTPPPRPVTLPS